MRHFAILGLTLGLALGFMLFTIIVILYTTSWVMIAGYCITTVLISDGSIATRMASLDRSRIKSAATTGGKSRVMLSPQ